MDLYIPIECCACGKTQRIDVEVHAMFMTGKTRFRCRHCDCLNEADVTIDVKTEEVDDA